MDNKSIGKVFLELQSDDRVLSFSVVKTPEKGAAATPLKGEALVTPVPAGPLEDRLYHSISAICTK